MPKASTVCSGTCPPATILGVGCSSLPWKMMDGMWGGVVGCMGWWSSACRGMLQAVGDGAGAQCVPRNRSLVIQLSVSIIPASGSHPEGVGGCTDPAWVSQAGLASSCALRGSGLGWAWAGDGACPWGPRCHQGLGGQDMSVLARPGTSRLAQQCHTGDIHCHHLCSHSTQP